MSLQVVSFKQISQILELTDQVGLNREWVEIPLTPTSPGVVDADQPFDQWLATLEGRIKQLRGS